MRAGRVQGGRELVQTCITEWLRLGPIRATESSSPGPIQSLQRASRTASLRKARGKHSSSGSHAPGAKGDPAA